jgi:NitT/TauT family transport system substrate-binding protein
MSGSGRWLRAAAISGVAVLVAAGCSSGGIAGVAQPGGAEKTVLNVSVVPSMDSAGFFVAMDQGYFTQEGLTVNYTPASSSLDTTVTDQIRGNIDITAGNYVSYIQEVVQRKRPLEVVAEGSIMGPGSQMLFAPADSDIKSLADLRGKTIGVNAPGNIDYLLDVSMLLDHGINADAGDVHFPDGSAWLPVMAQAAQWGMWSAITLPEPFASQAEQQFGMTPLADLDQGATRDFPIEGYVVTKDWAAKYPDTLKRFLIALEEGQVKADTDRSMVEHAFMNIKGPLGSTEASDADPYGRVDPQIASIMALDTYPIGVNQTRLQRVADVMKQFGLLKHRFDVSSMLLPSGSFNFAQFSEP